MTRVLRASPDQIPELARMANSVFRPDMQVGSFQQDFRRLFAKENATNLYYIPDENSKPLSFAGVVKSTGIINGASLKLASLGGVSTLREHRGKGFASQIIRRIICDLGRDGIALMLVSGGHGIYDSLGCVEVGMVILASYTRPLLIDYEFKTKFRVLKVSVEDRKKDAATLLSIYRNEPFRFSRSLEEMQDLLEALGYEREFTDHELFEIFDAQDKIVSYAVASRKIEFGKPAAVRIIEWSGSRFALVSSLDTMLEYYGSNSIEFQVQLTDVEMTTWIRRLKIHSETRSLQGTVRPINVKVLFQELEPWFEEHFGVHPSITKTGPEAWEIIGLPKKRNVHGFDSLAHLLFDRDELGIQLMLPDDLNYI